MKTKSIIVVIVLIIFFTNCNAQNEISNIDFSEFKGIYLGQKTPNNTPVFFANGLIANNYRSFHSSIVFTPDGTECYWQCRIGNNKFTIMWSRIVSGKWTKPEIAPFAKVEYRDDVPFVSPDGKKIFFISRRPLKPGDSGGKENIWVVDIGKDIIRDPIPLPQNINSLPSIHWGISVDAVGNLFFSINKYEQQGRRGDIYYAKYKNGTYSDPIKLSRTINTSDYEFSPFISPDGSYIIFSREYYGVGNCKLFISFLGKDGNWEEPIDLIENYGIKGICPLVTRDGKYLFFLDYYNSHSQPYWVDASFIEKLNPLK